MSHSPIPDATYPRTSVEVVLAGVQPGLQGDDLPDVAGAVTDARRHAYADYVVVLALGSTCPATRT